MAPLHIMHYNDSSTEEENDWILFGMHLEEAKRIGVEAISVDVWWGLVEIQNKYWSMLEDAVTNRGSPFRIPVFMLSLIHI